MCPVCECGPGISCQTGLADSALSKCVQAVSVDLAFSIKLDWLTGLSQNVSSM